MSSIFISYTTRDVEGVVWAEQLVAWCEEWQYGYFRDKDRSRGVMAGSNWRASLNQQLGLAQVVISLCSPSYESSSWCVWELAAAVERGKRVIPIQLGEKLVPNLVQNRQVIMVEQAVNPSDSLFEDVKHRLHRALKEQLDWRALQPWDGSLPPYPGLPAFEAVQAPVFFGRDAAVTTVRERLASLAQQSPAFLLLLGASGTGKSSLVRAGVLPRLEADSDRWQLLAPFTPGPLPFLRLAQVLKKAWALFRKLPPSGELGEREEAILMRHIQWLHATANAPVLLVVDQFEELLVEQQPEAERFLRFLQELLLLELSGVVLLATLRSDFLELMQNQWPSLVGMAVALTVQPIQPEDFGELILGPAQRSGLTIQPGLQDRLVKESGGRDALPLLAFTLEKLWQKRQARGKPLEGLHGCCYDLTLEDYQSLGGVSGAVRSQACLCWDHLTSNDIDKAALREAFLFHLVRLNEEGLATRQTARWYDLPELSKPLLKRFVKARLFVSGSRSGEDVVEIAHEALLRTWEPLKQWIEEGRQDLEQKRRVLRLCDDLGVKHPLEARLAALEGMVALGEAECLAVEPVVKVLEGFLSDPNRDMREWPLAIKLMGLVGSKKSIDTLSTFLEERQLREPTDTEHAGPIIEVLCQAAETLQSIYRRHPPCDDKDEQWLLIPSAKMIDNGRSVVSRLIRLRLWANPRLDPSSAWFEPLGDGVALTMVAIPPGSFLMGSPPEEMQRSTSVDIHDPLRGDHDDYFFQDEVSLEAFCISQTPITQEQWRKVMGDNPSHFLAGNCDRRPVEQVRWNEAISFCSRLSKMTGRSYILPSEVQWEYACRAGSKTCFHWGDIEISELANFNTIPSSMNAPRGDYLAKTSPVGQFPSNSWGLQDIHGNVREWCLDRWPNEKNFFQGRDYLELLHLNYNFDPNADRVLRGGSWVCRPMQCRSAHSNHGRPDVTFSDIGFRVACYPNISSLTPSSVFIKQWKMLKVWWRSIASDS